MQRVTCARGCGQLPLLVTARAACLPSVNCGWGVGQTLASMYAGYVAALPLPPNSPGQLSVTLANEPNVCMEWRCSAGPGVFLNASTAAAEFAAFSRDVLAALRALPSASRLSLSVGALAQVLGRAGSETAAPTCMGGRVCAPLPCARTHVRERPSLTACMTRWHVCVRVCVCACDQPIVAGVAAVPPGPLRFPCARQVGFSACECVQPGSNGPQDVNGTAFLGSMLAAVPALYAAADAFAAHVYPGCPWSPFEQWCARGWLASYRDVWSMAVQSWQADRALPPGAVFPVLITETGGWRRGRPLVLLSRVAVAAALPCAALRRMLFAPFPRLATVRVVAPAMHAGSAKGGWVVFPHGLAGVGRRLGLRLCGCVPVTLPSRRCCCMLRPPTRVSYAPACVCCMCIVHPTHHSFPAQAGARPETKTAKRSGWCRYGGRRLTTPCHAPRRPAPPRPAQLCRR
jgi:hypothetical protein